MVRPPAVAGIDSARGPGGAGERGTAVTGEGTSRAGRKSAPHQDDHLAADTSVAHPARIYNYLLGGKDNFPADRQAAEKAIDTYPGTVYLARANRAFLGRVVRYLADEAGITQFLDIGTGIPSAGSTHEVAADAAPGSRVVYVDYDPVVLAHSRELLAGSPAGTTDFIEADLRDTGAILARAAGTLDFSRPVAVLLLAILHAIGDEDDPHAIVATLMGALPAGSQLAISHIASDLQPEMTEVRQKVNESSFQQYTWRSQAEVSRFFGGLELAAPGLVPVEQWRPASEPAAATPTWSGVGRKP